MRDENQTGNISDSPIGEVPQGEGVQDIGEVPQGEGVQDIEGGGRRPEGLNDGEIRETENENLKTQQTVSSSVSRSDIGAIPNEELGSIATEGRRLSRSDGGVDNNRGGSINGEVDSQGDSISENENPETENISDFTSQKPSSPPDIATLSDEDFDAHIDTLSPAEAIDAISQRRGDHDADQYAHWRKAVLNKQRDAALKKLNAKHKPFDHSRYTSFPEMKRAEALYNQQISQQQDQARATIDALDKQIADINLYQNRRNAQIAEERQAENPLRNGTSQAVEKLPINTLPQYIARLIASGTRLRSSHQFSNGLARELGITPGSQEHRELLSILSSSEGMTPEQLAHHISENIEPEYRHLIASSDVQDIRNTIIDTIHSGVTSRRKAYDFIANAVNQLQAEEQRYIEQQELQAEIDADTESAIREYEESLLSSLSPGELATIDAMTGDYWDELLAIQQYEQEAYSSLISPSANNLGTVSPADRGDAPLVRDENQTGNISDSPIGEVQQGEGVNSNSQNIQPYDTNSTSTAPRITQQGAESRTIQPSTQPSNTTPIPQNSQDTATNQPTTTTPIDTGSTRSDVVDNQGNPVDTDGNLIVVPVASIDEITNQDFETPTRTIALPTLPENVSNAIGTNGRPVIIKKNVFEKNHKNHKDLSPADSREILKQTLFNPNLYGQNQKASRPYNWILIHLADPNTAVIIEVNENKENVEIVNWHYLRGESLEQKKKQAIKEGGLILTLESAVGNTLDSSISHKDSERRENNKISSLNFSSEPNPILSKDTTNSQTSNNSPSQNGRLINEASKNEVLLAHIDTWKRTINAPIVVLSNIHQVNNPQARAAIASATLTAQRYPGWFADDTIYIYLPHATDTADIDRTILHECIAHYGVRQLFRSPEQLNRFYDQVWQMMDHTQRTQYLHYPGISNLTGNEARRAAADEYIAHLAEQLHTQGTTITPEQTSIWQRIVTFLRNALRQAGINIAITDADINNTLLSAYQQLKSENENRETEQTVSSPAGSPSARRDRGCAVGEGVQDIEGGGQRPEGLNDGEIRETVSAPAVSPADRRDAPLVRDNTQTSNISPSAELREDRGSGVAEGVQDIGEVVEDRGGSISPHTTANDELDIFLRETRAANERHREQWKAIPHPRDLQQAYETNDTDAITQWKARWETFLQQLIPMDIPVIDGTITTASRNKAVKMVQTPSGYKTDKDSAIYKAFDYIEKSLVKRRRQLERNLTPEERHTIDIVKRGLRGELNNTRLRAVSEAFDSQLQQQIDGTLPAGHIYNLGMPSPILRSAGLPNLPIELAASRLTDKSMQDNHPFNIAEVRGLVDAIQDPLAIFRSATHIGSFVVLTEIQHGGRNFVVAIEANRRQGRIEVNSIRSVYPKNNKQVANWIEDGLLEYAHKERMSEWFSKQQSNSADVRKLFRHTAKIVQNFENPKLPDTRFRAANARQAIFISNARLAVENIRQDKATPEQWLAMLQNSGGIKAGEDRWLGLSDWLKNYSSSAERRDAPLVRDNTQTSNISPSAVSAPANDSAIGEVPQGEGVQKDRGSGVAEGVQAIGGVAESRGGSNTITRQQILDFIDTNAIHIEEVHYSQFGEALIDQATRTLEAQLRQIGWDAMQQKYPGIEELFEYDGRELLWSENIATIGEYEDFILDNNITGANPEHNAINETREQYTTPHLTDNHEIALTIPGIEPYNEYDDVHFGDAGGGRAIAWIRFGNTTDSNSNPVLVIDEIQSKRHQDGREKGYKNAHAKEVLDNAVNAYRTATQEHDTYRNELKEKYDYNSFAGSHYDKGVQLLNSLTEEERAKLDELVTKQRKAADELDNARIAEKGVPDAPFDKNWHELAFKRMLRYAAENGYHHLAWTTGTQQAERYDIGHTVSAINRDDTGVLVETSSGDISIDFDSEGRITTGQFAGNTLADVFGKETATKILNMAPGQTLSGDNLHIGGEGMKAFYDRMLPSFVSKYVKKWGSKVQDITLPRLGKSGLTMHSVEITPQMRHSVMQGQTMFRAIDWDTNNQDLIARTTTPILRSHGTFRNLDQAEQWAKKYLQGRSAVNIYTGDRIEISRKSVSEMLNEKTLNNSASINIHLAALQSVPLFIQTGIPAEIHPDTHGRDFEVMRLYNAIKIDGTVYRVKSTVRKVNQGDKYYTYEVQEMEPMEERGANPNREGLDPHNGNTSNNSIITGAKLLKGVKKTNSDQYILPPDTIERPTRYTPQLIEQKTNEINDLLRKQGYTTSVSRSTTHGMSNYINVTSPVDYRPLVKIRISDHSVTSTQRLLNEYHVMPWQSAQDVISDIFGNDDYGTRFRYISENSNPETEQTVSSSASRSEDRGGGRRPEGLNDEEIRETVSAPAVSPSARRDAPLVRNESRGGSINGEVDSQGDSISENSNPETENLSPFTSQSLYDYAGQVILSSANYNNKLPGSQLRFRMTHRTEDTVTGWINQRTDLNPAQRQAIIRYIDTLDGTALQLATARWFTLGTIRIPDDINRVRQAMQVARKAKVDPLSYDYPMAILDQFPNLRPYTTPINPDELPTLTGKQSLPHGITIYNVDDTPQAQQHIRDIIDTHLGTRANPWCITSAINSQLTDEARQFWKAYNAHPKRVAFRDGRIIAFFAADIPIPIWWDTQDRPHTGIPIAPLTEYNEQNNTIETYNPDGTLLNMVPAGETEDENEKPKTPNAPDERRDAPLVRDTATQENTHTIADATIAHIEQIGDDYTRYIDNIAEQVSQALTPQPTDDARTLAEKAILRFRTVDDTTTSPLAGRDAPPVREEISMGSVSPEEQDIIDNAKANGTYLLAPNGRPTNLTPRQWVQVRTQAFKQWFGDWLKAARINKLRNSTPINITFNNQYNLNRDSAKQWMKDNIRGEYTNKDTGETIQISRVGINEVTSHGTKDNAHLASITAIPQLIEDSIFIEEIPNEKGNNKYDSYRYYVCGAKINGEDYTIKVVIGVKGDSKYYDHRLTQMEKGILIDNLNGLSNSVAENQNASYSMGKDTKLHAILQTNASKIVDENGEPMVVYHGTRENFTVFDRGKNNPNNEGFYFTDKIDLAKKFAGPNGHVGEFYINIKNPNIGGFDGSGAVMRKSEYRDGGIFTKRQSDRYAEKGTKEFIVFSPNQIKSATDNIGTFDTDNPDIRFRSVKDDGRLLTRDNARTLDTLFDLLTSSIVENDKNARHKSITNIQEKYIDNKIRVKNLLNDLRRKGATISDEYDYWKTENMAKSRSQAAIRLFRYSHQATLYSALTKALRAIAANKNSELEKLFHKGWKNRYNTFMQLKKEWFIDRLYNIAQYVLPQQRWAKSLLNRIEKIADDMYENDFTKLYEIMSYYAQARTALERQAVKKAVKLQEKQQLIDDITADRDKNIEQLKSTARQRISEASSDNEKAVIFDRYKNEIKRLKDNAQKDIEDINKEIEEIKEHDFAGLAGVQYAIFSLHNAIDENVENIKNDRHKLQAFAIDNNVPTIQEFVDEIEEKIGTPFDAVNEATQLWQAIQSISQYQLATSYIASLTSRSGYQVLTYGVDIDALLREQHDGQTKAIKDNPASYDNVTDYDKNSNATARIRDGTRHHELQQHKRVDSIPVTTIYVHKVDSVPVVVEVVKEVTPS